jgi:hypothetical protein
MLPQALDVAAACGFTSTAASVVLVPVANGQSWSTDRRTQKKTHGRGGAVQPQGCGGMRLVRLPSMLGALLEDSRSMPAPVGPAKRPAFY